MLEITALLVTCFRASVPPLPEAFPHSGFDVESELALFRPHYACRVEVSSAGAL